MEFPIVTKELADRIEKYDTEAHLSRISGMRNLRGNPLAAEIRDFGGATAFIVHGAPYLEITRVLNLDGDDIDQIDPLLAWLREHNASPQIDVSPYHWNDDLLRTMAEKGLYHGRFLSVLYGVPNQELQALPVGVTVREFTQGEMDEFAAIVVDVQQVAPADQDIWREVFKAQLNGWRCYAAYVGGKTAGHAVMRIQGDVSVLMFAATKPEFRGFGAQTALLRQRIADAGSAGCDLVTTSSYPGTVSQRNQERAGLRVAYTKAVWLAMHRG